MTQGLCCCPFSLDFCRQLTRLEERRNLYKAGKLGPDNRVVHRSNGRVSDWIRDLPMRSNVTMSYEFHRRGNQH
jgi:hypothetical protein